MAYVRRFAFLCLLCVVFVCQSLPARAGTITVCSSGCTYTDIQAAIDAARFGDTILLRAGQTYVGHYKLRAKAGTGWITIRSDASASLLPAPGTRLVPSDRPGANTSLSLLPRLVGRGGQYRSAPLLRTDPGAHGYRIQYIDFDGVKNVGWESLMYLGEFGTAANAYDLELDHVYIHGHKYKGQKRAIALNSGKTSITDSYIADIKNVGFDTQAIACWNGTGPYTITNNHLEAAGENVMFGGTDPAVTNRVPADATFRRNLFTKPVAWRNEILSAPAGVTAAAQTGGALAAGTHYFKVVALMFTGPATAVSRPSAEVRATVSSGGKVTVSWSGVTGADKYRIYRGTAAGGEKVYIDTPGGATSFAYTGRGETAKTPAASGTMWTVKNIFELKNAERITLDGNILENIWAAAQFGYAIVLTPRNSNHTAPWARVKDIVFTNNLVRHASGIANISAYDDNSPSGRTTNVTFRNNVFQDIDRVRWGGNTMGFLIQNGPTGIVIDHNTNLATSSAIVYAGGAGGTGFVYTNNVSRHNLYGIRGDGTASGLDSLARYFPGSTVTCNVLAGGKSSSYPYPVPNAFPTEAQFIASFVDYAAGNYELLPGSVVGSLRCGGTVAGVDFDAYNSARGIIPPLSSPETANATPTASAGGPYSSTPGVNFTVDGSASHDSDGTISTYRWSWGDQILVRAAGLPGTAIHGY